jgi:hypothetical protein
MTKPLQIHFITWPDGKLFEGTQSSVDQVISINNALRTWLIPEFFPNLDLHPSFSPVRNGLWASMLKAGFKVHSLEVPTDVAEGVSR